MTLSMIWAQSADGFIGADGALPWRLPEDQAHFKDLTTGHPVVMGRATWDSLPARFRPLPGRDNIVLSRRAGLELPGAHVVPDVVGALAVVGDRDAWVIGGAQVYAAFTPLADRLEVTEVDLAVDGDTPAPVLDGAWTVVGRSPGQGWATSVSGARYRFVTLERPDRDIAARDQGVGR